MSLVLDEVVISLRMKRNVSKYGKQILTVYKKIRFWCADSCSPCSFLLLLLFVLHPCLFSLFVSNGKKMLTLGSEMEKTGWLFYVSNINIYMYIHIYICIYTHIYTYKHIYKTYIYIYKYIYIHTHTYILELELVQIEKESCPYPLFLF